MNDNNLEINSPKVHLFIGTRKGAFILSSDAERKNWHFSEILFKSWNVMHMTLDQRDSRLHAAVHHDVYGPSTHYSDDLEETRLQASQLPSFSRPSRSGRPPGTPDEVRTEDATQQDPEKVLKIWNITPGRISQAGMLYAGVEPAALFVSSDRGETWQINDSLFDHPHRADWFPGAGGLALHTILPHPQNESIMLWQSPQAAATRPRMEARAGPRAITMCARTSCRKNTHSSASAPITWPSTPTSRR